MTAKKTNYKAANVLV